MLNRLVIQINNKCNLNCSFCYVQKGQSEMDYKTAKKAVDFFFGDCQIMEYPNKEIIIMGGEPLLSRQVLRKIIMYVRKKYGEGPLIGLPSNLKLLTLQDLYFFKKMKVQLSWSIYPGWERILSENNFLTKPGNLRWLKIKFTVNSSFSEINDFYRTFLFFKNAGFNYFDVTPVIGLYWDKNNIKLFLEKIEKILIMARKGEIKFVRLEDCYNNLAERKTLAFCPRLNYEIFVDYNGRIFPCQWYSSFSEADKDLSVIGLINEKFFTLKKKIAYLSSESLNYRLCKDLNFKCDQCDYTLNCQKLCLGRPHLDKKKPVAIIAKNNLDLFVAINKIIEKH